MNNKTLKFLLSFCGVGFLPRMPGTFGSLAVIPFLLLMSRYSITFAMHLVLLVILIISSTVLIKKYQDLNNTHDESLIVIDEVIGMYIGYILIINLKVNFSLEIKILLLFVLFRFFDITKIWPAKYFDNQTSAFSVIADDLIAGIYSSLPIIIYSIFA